MQLIDRSKMKFRSSFLLLEAMFIMFELFNSTCVIDSAVP